MRVLWLLGAAVLLLAAPEAKRGLLQGTSFSVVVPAGWDAQITAHGGSEVLTATTRRLRDVPAAGDRTWPGRLGARDAVLQLAEVGNRPGTGGFVSRGEPPRLSIRRVERDGRFGGRPAAVVRFALRGRSFSLVAVFGARPPAARAFSQANALLRSLRVRPADVSQSMRARLCRPLRRLPPGVCRPAPDGPLGTSMAMPVGHAPAYVGLGDPGGTAVLRGDRLRGGLYLHKTLWAFAPSYRGPLLIRALGRRGRVRVATGRLLEWWLAASTGRGWSYAPSTTALPGPGCYAFQVDGTRFSVSIVFRARL